MRPDRPAAARPLLALRLAVHSITRHGRSRKEILPGRTAPPGLVREVALSGLKAGAVTCHFPCALRANVYEFTSSIIADEYPLHRRSSRSKISWATLGNAR